MAVMAALDPAEITALVVILSKSRPLRLLVAYLVGGFGVSMIVGAVLLFVLDEISTGSRNGLPTDIDIAIGVFALLVAVLVGTGITGQVRDRARQRRRIKTSAGADAVGTAAAADHPRDVTHSPALQNLPAPIRNALQRGSIWLAFIAGVVLGMPKTGGLAAIAAIAGAHATVTTSIVALVVFNVIAFVLTELFIVSFIRAPEATRERVDQLYAWTSKRNRLVVTVLATIVGVYLITSGIGKL
jgi:hypothetical protein